MNVAIYPDELMERMSEKNNLVKKTKEYAVYIGNELTENTVSVYASKELCLDRPGLQPEYTVTITGSTKHTSNLFSKDYNKELLILSENLAESIGFSENMKNTICFHLQSENENIKTEILKALGGIDKYYVVDNMSQQKNRSIIKGMLFLSLYILFMLLLSVASVVSLTYRYRYCIQQRELGILRVMGLSKQKEGVLFSLCNCVLGLKGILFGCFLSVPVNVILLEIFYEKVHFNPVIYLCIILINILYIWCYGFWVFRKNRSICCQISIGE